MVLEVSEDRGYSHIELRRMRNDKTSLLSINNEDMSYPEESTSTPSSVRDSAEVIQSILRSFGRLPNAATGDEELEAIVTLYQQEGTTNPTLKQNERPLTTDERLRQFDSLRAEDRKRDINSITK